MSGAGVRSFGCRLNAAEGEAVAELAAAAGHGDALVFNSCAVTAEAERQLRQAIRRAHREAPQRPILVTGCAAQVNGPAYAAMPEVAAVLGNAEKLQPAAWRATAAAPLQVGDIQQRPPAALDGHGAVTGRARAFLQVQQGCDHRCTFCIIPFGRGPSRSIPPDRLVEQVRRAVAAGHGEAVLTGVDLTAYGRDLPGTPSLGELATLILQQCPELPRLRLSSLDAAEIDPQLWRLLAEEARLMPYLHLSLQAGDDLVLKRMKRRHSRAQAIAAAEKARALRPEVALGADLIAGFPTETAAQHAASLALVAEAGLTWLHVFPYSPRPGTPAARMPQVPGPEIAARAAALRAAGTAAALVHLNAQLGRTLPVLVERGGRGHTPAHAPVEVPAELPVGSIQPLRMVAVAGERLVGVPPAAQPPSLAALPADMTGRSTIPQM